MEGEVGDLFCQGYDRISFPFDTEVGQLVFTFSCFSRDNQHTFHAEGRMIWPAAEILCHFLLRDAGRRMIKGKSILEVGAGQGLCGMLASYWAKSVILSDYDDPSLELLETNVEENFSSDESRSHRPQCQKLIWGNSISMEEIKQLHGPFDTIIGSDIIYYKAAVKPLLQTIRLLLSDDPDAVFILCNQAGRFGNNEDEFLEGLEENHLIKEDIDICSFDKEPNQKTHFFLIRKRQ
eukprot:TRINITY_DN6221_c0_g1_i1.p1 TRINITY_DN6221_c0_g1~~TRINITY_DN6221_c0_g1_i1.p1  ORF type:complete len:236 (-),score=35.29 TRINITY_DN6221_c0_g1_i1:6-713(-)